MASYRDLKVWQASYRLAVEVYEMTKNKHFLGVARGSAAELSTQLLLIQDIYDIKTNKLVDNTEEVQKMLYALHQKL